MIGYIVNLVWMTAYAFFGIRKTLASARVWPPIRANRYFSFAVFFPYVMNLLERYYADGIHHWNFQSVLPTANISPCVFFFCGVMLLLPEKWQKPYRELIAHLSPALMTAGIVTSVYYLIQKPIYYGFVTIDAFSHITVGLFGIFLVASGQVVMDRKALYRTYAVLYAVIAVMIICNLIFKTVFFGLSFFGGHNVYNVVISKSPFISAGFYLFCVFLVCTAGHLIVKCVAPKKEPAGCL